MVEFRSKLDRSKSKALNNNAFKRLLPLFLIVSVIFIALGVVGFVFREDDGDFFFAVLMLTLGVLITPLTYLVTRIVQKIVDKSASYMSSDTEEIYTFDEQYITITQNRGEEYSATTKAKYSYIYKAFADKDYYYLYISKMQCHVVDKSSITQGTLDEMNTLLSDNLGSRFNYR